jgi:hypothetical protein
MPVTVRKLSGDTEDLPITPADSGKTVWDFLKEKMGLDAERTQVKITEAADSEIDIADKAITDYEGKKLFIKPQAVK